MRVSEVVQYLNVTPKGPATPEQLAARNAERAANGEQAKDIADYKARMSSGIYAQPEKTAATPEPSAPASVPTPLAEPTVAPTVAPTVPTPPTAPVSKANLSWQELYNMNKDVVGSNPNLIKPGQQLKMPDGSTYTVKSGDSLSKIAKGFKAAPTTNKGTPTPPTAPKQPLTKKDYFAQANAYLDQQDAAATQKWNDAHARAAAARQKSANANTVVDNELAAMDKETASINASAKSPTASQYYIQPAKIGMNGEMDYVVVDKNRGVEVKSFNSPAEATAWIKSQPVSESLDRILTIAGLK